MLSMDLPLNGPNLAPLWPLPDLVCPLSSCIGLIPTRGQPRPSMATPRPCMSIVQLYWAYPYQGPNPAPLWPLPYLVCPLPSCIGLTPTRGQTSPLCGHSQTLYVHCPAVLGLPLPGAKPRPSVATPRPCMSIAQLYWAYP